MAVCLFRTTKWLIKKLPVPMKQATIILIKVKSYYALLRMLLACIRSHLKSILRNKFLILVTYHPDTLSLLEKEGEDPWLFFKAKMSSQAQAFGKHWYRPLPLQQAPRRGITSSRSVSTAHLTLTFNYAFVLPFSV